MSQYAVFIFKSNRWVMWSTHTSLSEAKREKQYLRDCLGVQAETFKKARSQ